MLVTFLVTKNTQQKQRQGPGLLGFTVQNVQLPPVVKAGLGELVTITWSDKQEAGSSKGRGWALALMSPLCFTVTHLLCVASGSKGSTPSQNSIPGWGPGVQIRACQGLWGFG